MKKFSLILVVLFLVSCNLEESCYLSYFEKRVSFPESYEVVSCEPDIYDIAIHFKLEKEDVQKFILKNKFSAFISNNEENIKSHEYFIHDMKNYFELKSKINIDSTYFLTANDNKKNYLYCLITDDGDFYGLIEKGDSLPPEW